MELIFKNKDKNLNIYKFFNNIELDSLNGKILLNGLYNWSTINNIDILNIKKIITNIDVKGYTIKDTIILENNNKNIHYFINFTDNNIEIWYIEGFIDTINIDNNLTLSNLLFILLN